MTVEVTEIVRRSEQGVTRPFLCRSAHGAGYFVKGIIGAGAEALRAEWIGGKLAKALKLPIPDFAVVEVDEALVAMSAVEGVDELGLRYAFGSQAIPGAQEITFTQSLALPLEWRARVLLFDWWTQHEDRMLSPLGGNPNLLTTGSDPIEPWLIDHHSTFDREFDAANFWKHHIFADTRAIWTKAWRKRESARLKSAAARLDAAWKAMPTAWLPDDEVTSALERDRLAAILLQPIAAPAEFWNIP